MTDQRRDDRRDIDRDSPVSRAPDQVARDLTDLLRVARDLQTAYAHVTDFAYSSSHWGEPSKAAEQDAVASGRTTAPATRPPVSEIDPTLAAVTSRAKQAARKRLAAADRAISEAHAGLSAARYDLLRAIREPADREIEDPGAKHPRVVSDANLAEARAARKRRRDRGET